MKSEYGDIKLNTKDYIAWDNIEIETSALPPEFCSYTVSKL